MFLSERDLGARERETRYKYCGVDPNRRRWGIYGSLLHLMLVVGVLDNCLIIDCPLPAQKMLHEGTITAGLTKPLDFDDTYAVVPSHLHVDREGRPVFRPQGTLRPWSWRVSPYSSLIRGRTGSSFNPAFLC